VSGITTVANLAELVRPGPAGPILEPKDHAPALLSWTSGTTGPPKAVALRSTTVALATACIADRQRLRADDVVLCATPATSSFQLVAALLPAAHVACQFVPAQGLSGPELWRLVDWTRATVLVAYTPVLAEFLTHAPVGGCTLRLAVCGGAPLPSSLKRQYRSKLHVPLIEAYGQSELGGFVAMGDPADQDPRALSDTGRPLPDRPAWADVTGELVLAGAAMLGYLGDPLGTDAALAPPGLHTGDIGSSDSDGYIRVLGRRGEQLSDGRWPREVEDVLFATPEVLHATVAGYEDRLVGIVSPKPGQKIDDVEVTRAAGLAQLIVLDDFPRTGSGKYDRKALAAAAKQLLSDAHGAE
jgi:acyl-coenzyme A synthetase/AMP-(fatty) acid ligase